MKQLVSSAIVLKRTNFGEADRIIQVITPDQGKMSLMAKGVRKVNSKLAGSIELFSTIDVTYIPGRGSINRLITARLKKHFSNITKDFERTNSGYDFIKIINKVTEDEVDEQWFNLLENAFKYLDSFSIDINLIRIWYYLNIFELTGHTPNLNSDRDGKRYSEEGRYGFDLDAMSFYVDDNGKYMAQHIKVLKLANQFEPTKMTNIKDISNICEILYSLIRDMSRVTLDI